MNRYFIEVSYKGTSYAGFQVQANAVTIQSEIEKAFKVLNYEVQLTGSSRTDAGVHALQNFFHFDLQGVFDSSKVYNLNAILPSDISITGIFRMDENAHSRFDAVGREYCYTVYSFKDPFLTDIGYYFPFKIDIDLLRQAAGEVVGSFDFTSFSKRNTQVKTFICMIEESRWEMNGHELKYRVRGNRFLRGMVRGMVGTMLRVGRGQLTVEEFKNIIVSKDSSKADFSVPGKGLRLERVIYPEDYFKKTTE
ncbi:MAG: tRNA pseudouridine(38-40) synthase TruA [Flavitalea sp.]